MAESITISQLPPPFKSMQYDLLRAEGLKFIQDLSGKIWTDENAHDPGITILEVLSYAITDLGYRTNYNIKDILTTDPNVPEDIKNFFPAKEIMPNYPVTINDYRKLMIDVEIPVADVPGCTEVGVKNAWIEKSRENEIKFYVDKDRKTLSYSQPNPEIERQLPKVLYDVLLQFDECEGLGDLNENTLSGTLPLYLIGGSFPDTLEVFTYDPQFLVNVANDLNSDLNGINVEVDIEFPRWDTEGVDWDDLGSIKNFTKNISLKFVRLPEKYKVDSYGLRPDKSVAVTMFYNIINIVDTSAIEFELDKFIYDTTDGLIVTYQKKVKAILAILATVKARLMANRNLGEDFFRFSAIKVEEILLCADIEIQTTANVEEVQADIFHQVERFLSPTVFFYTLQEMYDKGKTTDEIFEGPRLDHGFIDDEELTRAQRKKVIHVSDLISIIMDVPGVIAVKSIQVANMPLDNDDNIKSHAVKWCLDLAVDHNYIPLLSTERSTLTFFKDQLPYRANDVKAQALLDALEAADRPQKQGFPSQDIPLAPGEYKDIENYYSIQEEFPIVYGVGSPGLPATATVERHAQAKQLKAFLLFYDQLLADYLSQLFHVKDLFSMNENKGLDGNPIINKTYFTQSLMNTIPDGLPLYVNESNPALHAKNLQAFAEDQATFDDRRNRFLDHLMARFAESFNDYAMIVYKIDGPKAPEDLIQDKLEFLNNYPLISSARDTGFNYKSPCKLWDLENISGVERRVEFLTGVDTQPLNELAFGKNFDIKPLIADPDQYFLEVNDGGFPTPTDIYVYSPDYLASGFTSLDAARGGMEILIVNGVQTEKYVLYNGSNEVITDETDPGPAPYSFNIVCDGGIIGINAKPYLLISDFVVMLADIQTVIGIFEDEFYNNPESNRYNFECFMEKYVKMASGDPHVDTNPVIGCPDIYSWNYTLNDGDPDAPKTFLTGKLAGLVQSLPDMDGFQQAEANKDRLVMDMLRSASEFKNYRFGFDGGQEIFTVVDSCGDLQGTSFEEDFNQQIQDIFLTLKLAGYLFEVVGSTGNDGTYHASSVTLDMTNSQRLVFATPTSPAEPIPSIIADGFIKFTVEFPSSLTPNVIDANTADNYFLVDKNLNRTLFPGEKFTVEGGGDDDGEYTVVRIVPSGLSDSVIYVKEKIPSTTPGTVTLSYTKLVPIVAVDQTNQLFFIKPGADEVAAQELADWIRLKFFSHEGMHVVEHILLRPKYNGSEFVTVTSANGLKTTATPAGTLTFLRNFTTYTVNKPARQFTIAGDYTLELPVFSRLKIIGSTNANDYKVYTAVFTGTDTVITVYENIPDTTNDGTLQFSASKPITSMPNFKKVVIADSELTHDYSALSPEVFITGSGSVGTNDLGINDGMYKIDIGISPWTGVTTYLIQLLEKKVPVRDNFLPIDIDNDCGICQFDEPYSFIVSVVLPAWQGRFVINDFRRFFERTLRLESPAHLVLNVCWVDCKQMGEFEYSYKKWLIENAKENKDQVALSSTLNELIDVLVRLRSVYPTGTLHDCETDDTAQNSIILNNSIIGTL
jgi:hypothetical protein